MQDFQLRVVDEYAELTAKIVALRNFFLTETYKSLDPKEQDRMAKQSLTMFDYRDALRDRIANF